MRYGRKYNNLIGFKVGENGSVDDDEMSGTTDEEVMDEAMIYLRELAQQEEGGGENEEDSGEPEGYNRTMGTIGV